MPHREWDAEADVVIVGFGGAGACAAVDACDHGADVLVLDRFHGGGATAISGGVVYAGGGTPHQRAAGFDDSTESMLEYLRLETDGVVSDETLSRFCAQSLDNLRWLEQHGAVFEGSMAPRKTSYPTNEHYLYYSGNELAPPFSDAAAPAPRGHRAKGKGVSGKPLFAALRKAVARRPIAVRTQTRATGLVTDGDRVVGVEATELRKSFPRWLHRALSAANRKLNIYYRPLGRMLDGPIANLERGYGEVRRFRARRGVVLAAGGFVFNRPLLAEHAPAYRRGSSLGTIGDDGSGIALGESAGGRADRMHRVSAWRFFNPPLAMIDGVLVNNRGERICNEAYYGARIGDHVARQPDAEAYLIIDARTRAEALRQVPSQTLWFQRLQAEYVLRLGNVSGGDLPTLARKRGIDPDGLARTIAEYNAGAAAGRDRMGKDPAHVRALSAGPFHAIDCSIRTQPAFPIPMITLGGLAVDEATGAVTRGDGSAVPGLYAAGRNAVGVCSESYVSGLSIADCVFSGRRVAAALTEKRFQEEQA
ncbi:3-oxo-5alpha-steroid 4-dehydrogenase [Prauserella isguenensis]|uniref:3-oxo-5alpha-steroid 4-dehydrogenase n=1 Tax=Prauserella isguenensis TaxID=1470180 RepID=A0A839S5N2_9PSEU|nr:FAD-binding protein [Prauserella isguenensis]MBB3052674.1 3-oxo-5alpha-steroid 4-dehydrogenase [Prauserella isguenensis]